MALPRPTFGILDPGARVEARGLEVSLGVVGLGCFAVSGFRGLRAQGTAAFRAWVAKGLFRV